MASTAKYFLSKMYFLNSHTELNHDSLCMMNFAV